MVDRSKTFQIIANAVMILLVLFCLVPFALLIVSSITKETSLVKYGYSFIPREIDLAAYKYLLVDSTDIIRGYGISALVTVVGTICNLTITTLFAYPLSRKDLPARNALAFSCFLPCCSTVAWCPATSCGRRPSTLRTPWPPCYSPV